jgi:hypothetical protein
MTELAAEPDAALLQAVRPSARLMAADEGLFVRLLHEDIGSLVQRLPDGGWGFCERTARIVVWLTAASQPPEAVAEAMAWFAAANQADGFPLSEYVSVGHALVRVAREMSGPRWTSATGSAWIRFFMWMQSHLRAGAQAAGAQAAGAQATGVQAAGVQATAAQAAAAPAVTAQDEAARRRAAASRAPEEAPRAQASDQAGDAGVATVASLREDEDEDGDESDPGYGQVMLGVTATRRPPLPRRPVARE